LEEKVFETIFINGRFRAIKALWHIKPTSFVILNNWNEREEIYGDLLVFFDKIETVDRLIVMKAKPMTKDHIIDRH
jgi:hypothetical protein